MLYQVSLLVIPFTKLPLMSVIAPNVPPWSAHHLSLWYAPVLVVKVPSGDVFDVEVVIEVAGVTKCVPSVLTVSSISSLKLDPGSI